MKYLFLFLIPIVSLVADENRRTLSVRGEAEVAAPSNQVSLSLTVVTNDKAASEAIKQNRAITTKVLAAIKALGFEEKEYSTKGFNLNPVYIYLKDNQERVLKGYEVQNRIEVTTSKLESIGALIDQATASGLNQIGDLRYDSSDIEKYRLEAIQKAIFQAKQEAEAAAGAASIILGKISNIQIEPSSRPQPFLKAAAFSTNTEIIPSTVNVRAEVSLTFELD